jgi:hypothetical protein
LGRVFCGEDRRGSDLQSGVESSGDSGFAMMITLCTTQGKHCQNKLRFRNLLGRFNFGCCDRIPSCRASVSTQLCLISFPFRTGKREDLRGRSPDLSEVSGNHADQQLHRRPGGHLCHPETRMTVARHIKTYSQCPWLKSNSYGLRTCNPDIFLKSFSS